MTESLADNRESHEATYAVPLPALRAALPSLPRGTDYADVARKAAPWFVYAGLVTPERQGCFLANVAHESGGGRTLREAGYVSHVAALRYFVNTYAQKGTIMPAAELTRARAVLAEERRDPARRTVLRKAFHNAAARRVIDRCYVGRSAIQVTHRYNYESVGAVLGRDLVAQPRLLEQIEWALAAGAVWWHQNGANGYADGVRSADDTGFRQVCNLVNRGPGARGVPKGWAERRRAFTRIYPLLEIAEPPTVFARARAPLTVVARADAPGVVLTRGAKGAAVEELQLRLAGFRGTLWDGDFGPGTELQVVTFQRDYMGEVHPRGVVDEATLGALRRFAAEHPIDLAALRCPCGVCGGFGRGQFKGQYRAGSPPAEAFHLREYPGMHVAVLHALRAVQFYAPRHGHGRPFVNSGYRCWVDNEAAGRTSTNHMGKAVDCDLPMRSGETKLDDQRRCDAVRGLLVETGNCQIGWSARNRKSLEPASIAPTWVHLDVRCYDRRYLADRYFVRVADELDRSVVGVS